MSKRGLLMHLCTQEEEDKEHPAKGATAATDADEADEDEPAGPLPATARMNVTSALVEQWCTAVKESASMTAMKQLLKAYRWVVILSLRLLVCQF